MWRIILTVKSVVGAAEKYRLILTKGSHGFSEKKYKSVRVWNCGLLRLGRKKMLEREGEAL